MILKTSHVVLCNYLYCYGKLNSIKHWQINIASVLFGKVKWTVLTSTLLVLRRKRRDFYDMDINHNMPLALGNTELCQPVLFTNTEAIVVICFPKHHAFHAVFTLW